MKKTIALILALLMVFSCAEAFAYDAEAYVLKLDMEKKSPFGEFEGWGTSLCWWAHHLGEALPSDELEIAVKALYDEEDGLGLNIARYNIGGGDDPEHNHMGSWDGRDMPGVLSADGNYDYEKDKGQIEVLKLCVKYGADILEAFSNSPPYFMTESGCSSGGKDPKKDNLPKENYGKFAEFLANVVLHFKEEYGIEFDTLEPMNEPDTDYWGYEGWQEGCHISAENHSDLIMAVRRALDEKGLNKVGVTAADETAVSVTANNIANVYTKEALETLDRINTHSYHVGNYTALRDAAVQAGKKLYMTEVDGASAIGEDAGSMGPALWFSQKITDDLRGLEANAWVMWQAEAMAYTSGSNDKGYWNICQYDHEKKTVNKLKKYYAFMQFTKFIRPGDTLVKANSDSVLSAVNEKEGKAVFVITNPTAKEKDFDVYTKNLGMEVESFESYVTDNDRDCERFDGGSLDKFGVPANSIVTLVLHGKTEGKSIILSEDDGTCCAFAGDRLTFTVTDEAGEETDAEISLSDGAPAAVDGKTVTVKGEGNFTVTAKKGNMEDKIKIYAVTNSSKVRIVGQGSGKALNGRGKDIFIEEKGGNASQMWTMEREGEYFAFRNDRTGKYLSAENSLTTGERSDYALWEIKKSDGYYALINKETGKSIDVYNHATIDGSAVGMYDYNGGANQKWYFDAAEPETALDVDGVCGEVSLSGEPFGTESWVGSLDTTFDKAWDKNEESFFDASTGSGGYTGVDFGEERSFNRVRMTARPGFTYRLIGGVLCGSNEKDGEYEEIYKVLEEDVRSEKLDVTLPDAVSYRYVKYVSPEEGYCSVAEIELIYEPYEIKAKMQDGKILLDLGKKVSGGEEKIVLGYYDENTLEKIEIADFSEAEKLFSAAMNSKNDISVTVLGKENSLLCRLFIKKY